MVRWVRHRKPSPWKQRRTGAAGRQLPSVRAVPARRTDLCHLFFFHFLSLSLFFYSHSLFGSSTSLLIFFLLLSLSFVLIRFLPFLPQVAFCGFFVGFFVFFFVTFSLSLSFYVSIDIGQERT